MALLPRSSAIDQVGHESAALRAPAQHGPRALAAEDLIQRQIGGVPLAQLDRGRLDRPRLGPANGACEGRDPQRL
jgi:hypothetical protein